MVKVSVTNWQGGGSANDLFTFLNRKTMLKLRNGRINGGAYTIDCNANEASVLVNLNGVQFGGKALNIRQLNTNGNQHQNPQTAEIKVLFKNFLASRYDPGTRLLNLVNIKADQNLQARGFFNGSSASKVFQAILKVAEEGFEPVISVSLESNELADIQGVSGLSRVFPDLRNLSLANNLIPTANTLNDWKQRFPQLTELVLVNNPVSNNHDDMKKIVTFFPRLRQLNGVIVRSDADLPNLPMPIQPSFFQSPDIKVMAEGFLASFFKLWDSNRSQLASLYDDVSEFSYALDTICPHMHMSNAHNAPQRWLTSSRNLARATPGNMHKFLTEKIAIGSAAISAAFAKLPPTQHDMSDSSQFAMESWQIQNVRAAGDTGMIIAVHGTMKNTAHKGVSRYGFDRYFVVLPGPTGQMIVASDMMTVRFRSDTTIFKSNQTSDPAVAPVNGAPSAPGGAPAAVPAAAPNQEQVIQQLMQQTGLNLEYATQCAQQANFDLQQALLLFQQFRDSLPPNAFI